MTLAVEGLNQAERQLLLEFLFNHAEQDRFIFEHAWTPGDLLIWDNRCTPHAAPNYNPR
jgi:alpha-ketoglutarate-dependent taurine dioxygenase